MKYFWYSIEGTTHPSSGYPHVWCVVFFTQHREMWHCV